MPASGETGHSRSDESTLAIDIGGTLIKAAIVDRDGELISDFVRTPTPKPSTPDAVLSSISALTSPLPRFARISVGFPGVVNGSVVSTAPNLGTPDWRGFDLAAALTSRLSRPVRILNDAIVYGLGAAKGPGRECVLTLGTGMGCALFADGMIFQGLELGQHFARDGHTYDAFIGQAALEKIGPESWNERAALVIKSVYALTNCDRMFIGGGNSKRLSFALPAYASIAPLQATVAGGARLWHSDFDVIFATAGNARAIDPVAS